MGDKMDKDKYEATIYEIFGFEYDERPSHTLVGALWLVVIITFPIWIWVWVGLKFLEIFGKNMNRVKVRKVIKSRAEEHSKYY